MNKTKKPVIQQKTRLKVGLELVRVLTADELKSVGGMSGDHCATNSRTTGPTAGGGH